MDLLIGRFGPQFRNPILEVKIEVQTNKREKDRDLLWRLHDRYIYLQLFFYIVNTKNEKISKIPKQNIYQKL